jgi:hypothetical protein
LILLSLGIFIIKAAILANLFTMFGDTQHTGKCRCGKSNIVGAIITKKWMIWIRGAPEASRQGADET